MISPGGVCAVLDYDLDLMIEYVVEMTQRLLPKVIITSSALHKFVSGLLSSTRLPSTTILLGMHYLAKRVNMNCATRTSSAFERDVWRMLTIGLLLGSKFLDDNTFQNRSWSEVSGVPVADLNKMEAEWLLTMNYSLYVNLDSNPDYIAWMANWDQWCKLRNNQHKTNLDRLVPLKSIDGISQHAHSYSQSFNVHPRTVTTIKPPPGFKHSYSKTIWGHSYATPPYLTPPSAPDSGLTTPVYMSMNASFIASTSRYNDWASFDSHANHSYPRIYQSHAPPAYHHPTHIAAYHTPTYQGPEYLYGQSTWHNSPDCNLESCYTCNELRNMHAKSQPFPSIGLRNQILT